MNGIIPDPFISAGIPGSSGNAKESVSFSANGSFDNLVEGRMRDRSGENLLGAPATPSNKQDTVYDSLRNNNKTPEDNELTIAAMLEELMVKLKEMAGDSKGAPGEWVLPTTDDSLLQDICSAAGMDGNQLSLLMEQMENDAGLSLAKLFDIFARHFEDMGQEMAVTAPEPDLTLLEMLLARMGAPVDQVRLIADSSVTGDGKFDLARFLDGLTELDRALPLGEIGVNQEMSSELQTALQQLSLADGNEQPLGFQAIPLTAWEKEQLQNIFRNAGVSEESLSSIMGCADEAQFILGLTELKNIIAKGITAVETNRSQADMPAFLTQLSQLLVQSGFSEKSGTWTPVLQESIASIYNALLESVDMSTVQVKVLEKSASAPSPAMLTDNGQTVDGNLMVSEIEGAIEEEIILAGRKSLDRALKAGAMPEVIETQEGLLEGKSSSPFGIRTDIAAHSGAALEKAALQAQPKMMADMPQNIFDQLTQGVVRGLKNNEHQLVLRLYPQELGEVKVNLIVQDERVTVSFAMENNKVKEVLESNMSQFRENMEQRGFDLQECMVSVDQREDNHASREFAHHAQKAFNYARVQRAGAAEESPYGWHAAADMQNSTISVLV